MHKLTDIYFCGQTTKEEHELNLARFSFTTDMQVFAELDGIDGTSNAVSYSRRAILQFLRSKGWTVEELEGIADEEEEQEKGATAGPKKDATERPKIHIVFPSSSENSQDDTTEGHGEAVEEDDDDDEDDHEDDEEEEGPSAVSRSGYVGRGNVQAVRTARKNAGLNEAFPRSDPLLKEFSDFMRRLCLERQKRTMPTK